MIGSEREFEIQKQKKPDFAGVRTFTLIALFGAIAAYLSLKVFESSYFLIAGFIALIALITASTKIVINELKNPIGITTQVSSFITFILGIMCVTGYKFEATIISIVVLIFLALKEQLHGFIRKIKTGEIYATIKFAVVSMLVLPFLPNVNYSLMDIPYLSKLIEVTKIIPISIAQQLNVFNPFQIWLMVVLISSIGFVGYVLIRIVGTEKGIGLTGLLGGIVSSTAVSIHMAVESKKEERVVLPFVLAVIIACSIMFIKLLVEVLFVNASLLKTVFIPLIAMCITGFISSLIVWRMIKHSKPRKINFKSPFAFMPAVKFGLFFAFIMIISKLGNITLGNQGIYIAAFISGLADADAITLSVATLASLGDISAMVASIAVVIGAITNTLVKGAIAYFSGAAEFRKRVLFIVLIIIFVGILAIIGMNYNLF